MAYRNLCGRYACSEARSCSNLVTNVYEICNEINLTIQRVNGECPLRVRVSVNEKVRKGLSMAQRQRFDPNECTARVELGRNGEAQWQSERSATRQPAAVGVDANDSALFDGSEDAELEIRRMVADMERVTSQFADLEAELLHVPGLEELKSRKPTRNSKSPA